MEPPPEAGPDSGIWGPDAGFADTGRPPGEREEADFATNACFNGLDDDANSAIDCEDRSSCGATAYCCVGESRAECCAGATTTIDQRFDACVSSDPTVCIASATRFGGPHPTIVGGAFVPFGDALGDSGLALGEPLDLTRDRVVLEATFEASADGCGTAVNCVDVIGLGVGAIPGIQSHLVPDVAVAVRPSRGDYALLVGGEVLASRELPDGPADYALTLAPDGTVELSVDDGSPIIGRYFPLPERSALLYGRTHNLNSESAPARAASVQVRVAQCDVLDHLARGATAELPPESSGWGEARAPSVAVDGARTLAAFAVADAIHLAEQEPIAGWTLLGSGTIDAPVLVPPSGDAYDDPELVVGADAYTLFFTHRALGETTIGRADGGPGFGTDFALSATVIPSELVAPREPTYLAWSGAHFLAVVDDDAGNGTRIVLLRSADGLTFEYAMGSLPNSIIAAQTDNLGHFAADEVSGPDLAVDNAGIIRLYYAGRRGSRWSIGLLVSGDGSVWRDPNGGTAILTSDGEGYDGAHVSCPSVVFESGEVALYFEASDGNARTIGRATGWAR